MRKVDLNKQKKIFKTVRKWFLSSWSNRNKWM